MERLFPAFLISAVLAFAARAAGLVVTSSAIFGFLLTFSVLAGLGIEGLIILVLFFPITTHLSLAIRRRREEMLARLGEGRKISEDEILSLPKDRPRLKPDWKQVAANGAVGGLFALFYLMHSIAAQNFAPKIFSSYISLGSLHLIFIKDSPIVAGFVASIASAASDTASHEVGITTRGRTYSPISFKEVSPGTIGGVSLLGSLSAIFCILIFILASYFLGMLRSAEGLAVVLFFAIIGNLADSLLGALFEKRYRFWSNDITNLVATFISGVGAWACLSIILGRLS